MHDRSVLGPADVGDDVLAEMVALLLCVDEVELLTSRAEHVPYDLSALTTAGRYLVRGTAAVGGRSRDWSCFVKHVQEWSRSPVFAEIPEELRPAARGTVPWRTEGEVYRSDIASRLPRGLAMPRSLGVHEIDDSSYAVWLELVPVTSLTWDLERYCAAALLLGRFAGSPEMKALGSVREHPWDVSYYAQGRLTNQVLPLLHDPETWRHPLARPFELLRGRLLDAADRLSAIVEELMRFPVLTGHGDGCPNNLLVSPGRDGFTIIDFGFFGALPVGFDLGQLLVGDVQLGRHGTADLAVRDEACVVAYHAGLLAEGVDVALPEVRRAHALQLLLFTGLTTLPLELLGEEPSPALVAVSEARAELGRFSLDLLDATA